MYSVGRALFWGKSFVFYTMDKGKATTKPKQYSLKLKPDSKRLLVGLSHNKKKILLIIMSNCNNLSQIYTLVLAFVVVKNIFITKGWSSVFKC